MAKAVLMNDVKAKSASLGVRGLWVPLLVFLCATSLIFSGCRRPPSGPSPLDANQEEDQKVFAGMVAGIKGQVEVAEIDQNGKIWKLSEEASARVIEILHTQRPAGFEGGHPEYKLELRLPNPKGVPGFSVVRLKGRGSKLAYGSYVFEVDGMGELRKLIQKPN